MLILTSHNHDLKMTESNGFVLGLLRFAEFVTAQQLLLNVKNIDLISHGFCMHVRVPGSDLITRRTVRLVARTMCVEPRLELIDIGAYVLASPWLAS